jgi:hypothetical protein
MSSSGPAEAIAAINECAALSFAEKAAIRSKCVDIHVASIIVATPPAEREATIRHLLQQAHPAQPAMPIQGIAEAAPPGETGRGMRVAARWFCP